MPKLTETQVAALKWVATPYLYKRVMELGVGGCPVRTTTVQALRKAGLVAIKSITFFNSHTGKMQTEWEVRLTQAGEIMTKAHFPALKVTAEIVK